MSLTIRRARSGEAGLVLSLVRELAEYEHLLHEVEATEATIGAALFGGDPRLFCEIADWNGQPAGSPAHVDDVQGRPTGGRHPGGDDPGQHVPDERGADAVTPEVHGHASLLQSSPM